MRAIILAAGEGTRLKKYTQELPKGMLEFAGKTLIERQIEAFRSLGIDDIVIVRGFEAEKIDYPGITYVLNPEYATTNMVTSLFYAEEYLEGSLIVSYADIVFNDCLLKSLIIESCDVAVSVDMTWKAYWKKRHGSVELDTESLKLDCKKIISLGVEDVPSSEIDGRYIGLIKFSARGVEELKRVWHKYLDDYWDKPWQVSGKPLKKAYLTDMLSALIDEGVDVTAMKTMGGWLEFDTNEDYEKAIKWLKDGTIKEFITGC